MLIVYATMSFLKDRMRWRCRRQGCEDNELGVRCGSPFKETMLAIGHIVRILFYWATMKFSRQVVEDLEVSSTTAVKW